MPMEQRESHRANRFNLTPEHCLHGLFKGYIRFDQISRDGWRPQPSHEVLIPKASGGTRPLAIGCLEDKIVQQLVTKILEAIYDDSFHRHSFGLYIWDGFAKRLRYKPLLKPSEASLIDITSGIISEVKRNMKSRMRKSSTYGSENSPDLSQVFT